MIVLDTHNWVWWVHRHPRLTAAQIACLQAHEPHGLGVSAIDLRAHGIDEEQAAELRARLAAFAEDWDRPEMDVYDDYDAARARLQKG